MSSIIPLALSKSASWQAELDSKIHTKANDFSLNIHPDFNTPDILANTVYNLEGCQGNFSLYFEDESYRHDRHKVHRDYVFIKEGEPYLLLDSVESMLAYCLHIKWKGVKLIWQSDKIDDRNMWPGGYNNHSIYVSNARVIRDEYEDKDVFIEDDGIAFDVRFISEDLLETITSLEDYPLVSDDDHSELQSELEDEAWENWAADEWRSAVINEIQNYIDQSTQPDLDPEDYIGGSDDADLFQLFRDCCDTENVYWEEESGDMYIRINDVAKGITISDIRDLTKLNLLSASQQWRTEDYPWLGAEPAPLEHLHTV
jgi:hypothetical protein